MYRLSNSWVGYILYRHDCWESKISVNYKWSGWARRWREWGGHARQLERHPAATSLCVSWRYLCDSISNTRTDPPRRLTSLAGPPTEMLWCSKCKCVHIQREMKRSFIGPLKVSQKTIIKSHVENEKRRTVPVSFSFQDFPVGNVRQIYVMKEWYIAF